MSDSERMEAARMALCRMGLSTSHHDTIEKAVEGALKTVESLRAALQDPPHDVQCVVLRKLKVRGYCPGEKPEMQLAEFAQ